jgi:hypothetical protein
MKMPIGLHGHMTHNMNDEAKPVEDIMEMNEIVDR